MVVIAPDKFKGSLSATQAARAIRLGVLDAMPQAECSLCPMADGGEGTVEVFLERGAARSVATVRGPLGEPVDAVYARSGDTAILEMSAASGLALVPQARRDPMRADTFGTGQLIESALSAGAQRIIIGLGGSATTDAGTGMLRALGVRFLDERQQELGDGIAAYEKLRSIDMQALDKRAASLAINAAIDVDNPLCGPHGAAKTFARQKGASPEQIERLDGILSRVADVAARTLERDDRDRPGAGAAGGLGFALMAFLNAKAETGVRLIARECGLNELLKSAQLCLTGEGSIDEQTLHGKTVYGVAQIARELGVPVIAFGGIVDAEAAQRFRELAIDAVQISPAGMPAQEAMAKAAQLLRAAARTAVEKSAAELG